MKYKKHPIESIFQIDWDNMRPHLWKSNTMMATITHKNHTFYIDFPKMSRAKICNRLSKIDLELLDDCYYDKIHTIFNVYLNNNRLKKTFKTDKKILLDKWEQEWRKVKK